MLNDYEGKQHQVLQEGWTEKKKDGEGGVRAGMLVI